MSFDTGLLPLGGVLLGVVLHFIVVRPVKAWYHARHDKQ